MPLVDVEWASQEIHSTETRKEGKEEEKMQAFADAFRDDAALMLCEKKRQREEEEDEEDLEKRDEGFAWELQVEEENEYAARKLKKRMKRLRDAGLSQREARERVLEEYESEEAGMDFPRSPIASPTARSAVRK
eukprot:1379286-Rhodomonas_salina.1